MSESAWRKTCAIIGDAVVVGLQESQIPKENHIKIKHFASSN